MSLKLIQVGAGSWGEHWCRDFLPPNIAEGLIEVVGVVDNSDSGFCPVCILNRAFDAESKATWEAGSLSGSAASPGDTQGTPQVRRFEHYEVMSDEAGRPIELGRGAGCPYTSGFMHSEESQRLSRMA